MIHKTDVKQINWRLTNKMEYIPKDISIIIPTMNRTKELLETISYIPDTIKEIIIIDQGKEDTSWKENLNRNIPIKIIHSDIPSITIARNKGLQYATGNLICYLDDDVSVNNNYFENICTIFNTYPKVEGVAAWRPVSISTLSYMSDYILRGFFGIRQYGTPTLCWPYSNRYPTDLSAPIQSQWLPGMNMVFKKEVFTEHNMRFDENLLGYTLAEDIDFTYRIYKRNNQGLIITPAATITHRDAATYRKDVRKISYINQVDHLYFAMKHDMISKWYWNIFGITLLRTLIAPLRYQKWKYYIESLGYCFKNWDLIKQGKVREWI